MERLGEMHGTRKRVVCDPTHASRAPRATVLVVTACRTNRRPGRCGALKTPRWFWFRARPKTPPFTKPGVARETPIADAIATPLGSRTGSTTGSVARGKVWSEEGWGSTEGFLDWRDQ